MKSPFLAERPMGQQVYNTSWIAVVLALYDRMLVCPMSVKNWIDRILVGADSTDTTIYKP